MDRYIRPKLDEFLVQHPKIECDFATQLPHGHEALKKSLDEDSFDCALVHVPAGVPLEQRWTYLARVEGGIYGHVSFTRGERGPLTPETLSRLPFILPPLGSTAERNTLKVFADHGIRPIQIISRPQYFDVIASMVERGLGVASLTNAMFSKAGRADIVLLYPLTDWLLVWHRREVQPVLQMDAVQDFLVSAVLQDPAYPALPVN
jgi:DNA-binding transcriptional LysR family regulator